MKQFSVLITLLIFSITYAFGQNITYDGEITDLDSQKPIGNVTVAVISGGSTITSAKTSANGKYSVQFLPGKKYTIKYSKTGYVSKIITIDVGPVIGEDLPAGGKIFPPINLDLFTERPGVDFSFLNTEPVVKWSLDRGDRMNYDKGQMVQIKNKIESKLKEAQNKGKNLDAEYNQLIKEADEFYKSKELQEALDKYVAALKISGKQKEAHPNARLMQIEELLRKKEKEDLAFKQDNEAYMNLITAADNLASNKEYDKAIAKYKEATAMKSDEQYPKDRVVELVEEKGNVAKRDEYDKIIKRADGFYKQSSVEAARDAYQEALKILPKEEYPAAQLKILGGKIDALTEEREKKDNYNNAITAGDDFYDKEDYAQAVEKYKEALSYESAATYPVGRIKMAQDIIDEQEAAANKIKSFNKLVAEGDANVSAKEFEGAVAKYTEAYALIEDEAVQAKLDKVKQLLAEQKNKEEQQQQIEALMTSAQEKIDNEAYQKAIEDFSAVLTLVATHPDAIAGKKKAEDLLADMQSQLAKDNKFNELLAAADKAYDAKTWDEAKDKYLAAQVVYDDREHVNNRIVDLEAKIKAESLNDEISSLMTSANEKINNEDLTGAIIDFDAVLKLQEDHKEAIEGKKKAEQLLADEESQHKLETAFKRLVSQADNAFNNQELEVAKEKYLEAKEIFDDREHVNTRLNEIETALNDALAKEEQSAHIQALLDEASALKPGNKWAEVIKKYEQALAIDEERDDVLGLLEAAKVSKKAWEDQQSQEEILTKIQTLLDEAEVLKLDNKWAEVIQKYEKALAIDEERSDVSEMIAAAKVSKIAWEETQSQEEQEEEFNSIVAKADVAFEKENWENARDKYLAAKEIFDDREHVNTRITETNSALAGLQAEEEGLVKIQTLLDEAESLKPENQWESVIQKYESALAIDKERTDVSEMLAAAKQSKTDWETSQSQEETSARIQALLDEAEVLKLDYKWESVIQKYESALVIDKERTDVSEMLTAAKQSKTEWEKAQSKGEQFEQLKQAGNEFLAKEKWNDAKYKFVAALEINADNEIDASLALIENKLAEEAALQDIEEQYKSKMDIAEEFATDKSYAFAINSFNEALEIKENDPIAKSRIKDMQQKLDALILAENKDEKYHEAMALGNKSLVTEDYSAAIKAFDDALLEKSMDSEATRLKEKARSKIKALQSEEEEYNGFIETGLAKYDEAIAGGNNTSKLAEAKSIFESAQNIRPQASLPQNKIVKIDNLLRQIEEDAAADNQAADIESRYQDQLQLASVAVLDSKYKNAIDYLKEAQKIKPEENYPATEIKKFQAIIDNQSAQKTLNANYTSLINKADLAFSNKNYEQSIILYNDALRVKSDENYPKSQIAKAQEAIENGAENELNKEYQSFMDKADAEFLNKEYEKALINYKSALTVKENDSNAKAKVDETQQVLNNLLKAQKENASQKKLFNQFIAEADQLFNGDKYLEAKSVYEKALRIETNDAHAIKRVKLCIEKAQEKAAKNNNLRYDQSIASADKLFKKEEYNKAREAYKRALSLRSNEPYPRTQLVKIEAIKNANVKAQGSVEYIGEKSDISIMEGAALLEKGAIQRERMKQDAVANRLSKFEGEEADRSLSDFEERLAFENEVTAIKDRRDASYLSDVDAKRDMAKEVDDQLFKFEKSSAQLNRFKEGDLSRANQELVFVSDDFDQEKANYRALHKDAIEQIKTIENERSDRNTTELKHHDVRVTAMKEELVGIENKYDEFREFNDEFQKDTEEQLKIIELGRDELTISESNEEYSRVILLQDDAVLAEMRVAESTKEKDVILQQLNEDMYVYEVELQRKIAQEASEVHREQLEIDSQLTGAEEQYRKTQESKDDARLLVLEQLKEIDQDQLDQYTSRLNAHEDKTQANNQEIETVKNMNTEKSLQNIDDLVLVDNEVKTRELAYERAQQRLEDEEGLERQSTVDKLLNIDKKGELSRQGKDDNIKDNYEELKNQEIGIENKNHNIDDQASKDKQEIQKYVDGLENNEIKFTETIANTIGDDYLEGVTQENYVRNDSKGIPIKIVTRRIVVADGRGEVYIRTQTRGGLTYSKNGSPITEQNWINGTENAKLEKHY